MTKIQKEELKMWQTSVNHPKHELIDILREIERLSPRKARGLDRLIARLESWQNTK